mmetsp:Transcript_14198/g.44325  ORF Transcript_14198/g.44325 Transcript_14198/m.44325 type:complete len:246 (+) Transcript_14198:94-831(+)
MARRPDFPPTGEEGRQRSGGRGVRATPGPRSGSGSGVEVGDPQRRKLRGARGLDPEDAGEEDELGVQGVLDVLAPAEAVLLPWVDLQCTGDAPRLEGRVHRLRLAGRHDPVLRALQEQDGAGELLGVLDGRAGVEDLRVLGVPPHEPVQVATLELVRVPSKGREVRHPVEGAARGEDVSERQGPKSREPSGGATVYRQLRGVDETLGDQELRACADVLDVHHAPVPLQSIAVCPPVACAAPVIHI